MQYDIKIQKVDLDLLRDQKKVISELQWKTDKNGEPLVSAKDFQALEGIISLIDHIQDQAVEQYNLDENQVFNFTEE